MSKWSSWATAAVSGLENRLDKVLGEEDGASAKTRALEQEARQAKALKEAATKAAIAEQPKPEQGMSRTGSQSTSAAAIKKSRLQEKLERASQGRSPSTSRPSTEIQRTASPITADTTRSSIDSRTSEIVKALNEVKFDNIPTSPNTETKVEVNPEEKSEEDKIRTEEPEESDEDTLKPAEAPSVAQVATSNTSDDSSRTSEDTAAPRTSVEHEGPPTPAVEVAALEQETALPPRPRSPTTLDSELTLLQMTHTQALEEHHVEVTSHLERIDALQSKLNYLSDQLSTASKAAASDAPTSSLEKQLAERDNQIAELMKEGEKLSKKELQQSGLIKKLRVKIGEQDKEIVELKRRVTKAEQNTVEERERSKRAEAAEKISQDKLKIVARIERDVEEIKREKEGAAVTITELRKQLADSVTRAEQAEKRAQSGALEAERRTVAKLKEELEDIKIEKKLAEDRLKTEVHDIKEEAARQSERAKVAEMELKSEISNLETKLEVLRSRTEEVSSAGDSQTKLLRQIETLQTQYALASENWQGIESTLTSRVAALEKERDDVSKRESDIRRKARDVNSKARRLEDELDSVNDRAKSLEQDVQEQRNASRRYEAKAAQVEAELQDTRSDFDRQKKVWDTDFNQRLEMEKAKWKSDMMAHTPTDTSFLRADSPGAPASSYMRKHPTAELAGLGLSGGLHTRRTRPESRRGSGMPVRSPDMTPKRQDSTPSLSNMNGGFSQAPSIHPIMDEDFDTISSPRPTINDVISASTAGAGPSVQLVERMSAAVRRLESEKAASKEEMARMLAQRDEARNEVVALMREVEDKRAAAERVAKLEEEVRQMDARYQTTLEMLGEKSERVDELTNDVQDLKNIYRDLVERTMS